uniref:BTB/POZ domain-containing protein n=1 Tax=Oryzias latipes TaxID=8090 RepID=A0A3B3H4M2_ORYLA
MKPDGVATAALEPIETLESNTANEEAPPTEQEPNQATAPAVQEMLQQPAAQTKGHVDPQPNQAKEGSAAKTNSKNSAEPKATNKGTAKTKPGSTSSPKPISGPRTSTPQNRIANGVTKPQMNGAAKKTAPAVEKKSTPTPASSKKPAGAGATVPKTPAKVGEKKAVGLSVSSNSSKAAGGAAAVKKPPSTTANGVKSNTAAAAAKKPPAAKPANSTPKPSAVASTKPDKPPVSKTTRATTSTPTRPTTGSSQSATTPKSPMVSSKPATPKTPSNAGKPATSKSASSTPSGGKPPVSQASRNTTPAKKDVTKPSTPAARKPADSPLTRPSSSTKSSKPETPKSSSKSDATAKKSNPNKISESKTPNRTKTQEGRATPSKNSGTKPAAAKTTSPKKTVGSSTPTPVKRAPKPAAADGPGKEVAAAIAAAAAIATATAVAAEPEGLQPQAEAHVEVPAAAREETPEAALEPVPESQSACEAKSKLLQEPAAEPMQEPRPQPVRVPTPEPVRVPTPEPVREPTPEPVREPTPEPVRVPTPEPVRVPTPEPLRVPTPEPMRVPTPEPMKIPTPEPMRIPTPEPIRDPTPAPAREPAREPTPEPKRIPTPEPMRIPTPEPMRIPTPEPMRIPTPEPIRDPTPAPAREPTPEPKRIPTPEPIRVPTPEPVKEPTPEPMRIPTPEPVRVPTPEPARESTPNYLQESTSEVVQKPTLEYLREPTPEPTQEETEHESGPHQILEPSSEILVGPPQPSAAAELGSSAAQMDHFQFQETTNNSFPSLGTTVMSPPCSPPGPASPVRQPQSASPLLRVDVHSDSWAQSQEEDEEQEGQEMKGKEEDEEREKENLFLPPLSAPGAFDAAAQLHFLGASPPGVFIPGDLTSPGEKEEAVEKADEEINEDDEDEDDEEEDEQRRLGHQLSSMITDMSSSQPSDEFQVRSSVFGGSAGWHGDDLLSGMDSEDVSSCTSSRQPGVSDLSSTLHTAILEGTQSSDALVDSSLRGSEGDGNLMGSPNVETLANEEEEDEDEEDERVDDMDMSSEQVEEQHGLFKERDQNEEEEDEDVEMHSEGLVESGGNMDEDGFNEEERSDNINLAGLPPCAPPISSWSQTNPFSDTWSQPASLLSVSSPSPMSDHGAAESETPTQSPAQACLDSGAPSFAPQTEHQPGSQPPEYSLLMGVAPEEAPDLLVAPAVGVSQSSTLSGGALAAHSSSETSTPEELQDYDSSSGVESRSDKQQTPVPASLQPDVDQDLGIHMEKGDGEEEEAETLPADEVPGTGPPTAPASDPSSPSTSGDEASDTEGEIQINDPETPIKMDAGVEFESPSPTCGLPALEEEAGNTAAGEGEEDGGGTTPQSANSVASYGFDCTTSNSNAHSMAESCGKSPGIFSLENEEQLPEEAKDPSLIKELTLPSAAAARPEDLLGGAVDLMPLSHTEDPYPSLDERHYLLGGKLVAEHVEGPQEPGQHTRNQEAEDPGDFQPPYFSTVCDKTDSFLEGDEKSTDEEEEHTWQSDSQEDNWNQNPVANCHYLALVPGNRRPIDPALAEHFAEIAPPPPLKGNSGEQLRRMEQTQEQVKEMQETQKREWLEEEQLRLEQQRLLERQRRELLQLQLQQQQHEHRHRRQLLQWQLELEHQYRMQQKQIQQQQQQLRRSPTGVMLSPSSGLCTIYESMETSDEEDEAGQEPNKNLWLPGTRVPSPQNVQKQPRPVPPQDLEWNQKVDMVQQLINQTLLLSGDGGCPPLLLLPVGTGGILSPLESNMWPSLPPQFSPPAATVTSVSSYSPDSRSSSPSGDWTVVELETQH